MILLLLVVFGLVFGSFVNALVWRLHEKRDWVQERSECTHCHHVLAPKDLVPVLSYVLLKGKCRYCRKPIQDKPYVELVLPALFVISYLYWPLTFTPEGVFLFVSWLLFLVGFTALSLYDAKWFLLPDVIVFPLIALAFVQVGVDWALYNHSSNAVVQPAIGVVIISGLFLALYHVSRGKWIGFGDVKLGVVLGILAGGALPALLVLLLSSLIGTAVALPLVLQGKAGRKTHLPFGPLLIAGIIITKLFGAGIITWYMNFLTF
jgi:prepilin signal peptidase PulO-like enzyme (type II secretory pathway)